MIEQTLGKRIAQLRKAAGLTQEGLAEKSNYSVEFMSAVERGVHAPSVSGLERIAKALKKEVKDLFNFKDHG